LKEHLVPSLHALVPLSQIMEGRERKKKRERKRERERKIMVHIHKRFCA